MCLFYHCVVDSCWVPELTCTGFCSSIPNVNCEYQISLYSVNSSPCPWVDHECVKRTYELLTWMCVHYHWVGWQVLGTWNDLYPVWQHHTDVKVCALNIKWVSSHFDPSMDHGWGKRTYELSTLMCLLYHGIGWQVMDIWIDLYPVWQ